MLWGEDQDKDLLDYYRWLIHFRRQHPVLRNGRRQTLHVDNQTGTYVYARINETETILVALNLSDETTRIECVCSWWGRNPSIYAVALVRGCLCRAGRWRKLPVFGLTDTVVHRIIPFYE